MNRESGNALVHVSSLEIIMKSTVTFQSFTAYTPKDYIGAAISPYDLVSVLLAKFFDGQNRTYKSKDGVSLDTISIHSNEEESYIGIRFYYKNRKIQNRRRAVYAQYFLQIDDSGGIFVTENDELRFSLHDLDSFYQFCDDIASDAVDNILEKLPSFLKE